VRWPWSPIVSPCVNTQAEEGESIGENLWAEASADRKCHVRVPACMCAETFNLADMSTRMSIQRLSNTVINGTPSILGPPPKSGY